MAQLGLSDSVRLRAAFCFSTDIYMRCLTTRVVPAQNIHSSAVLRETLSLMAPLFGMIGQWFAALPPGQRHLLAGIEVGWEAGIGANAYYYPKGNQYEEKYPKNSSHDPTSGLNASKGMT
jgi:hypothetical protein